MREGVRERERERERECVCVFVFWPDELVADCDTMHGLVKEYRETRKILLNIEHRLMLAMTPDYDQLPLIGKVCVCVCVVCVCVCVLIPTHTHRWRCSSTRLATRQGRT